MPLSIGSSGSHVRQLQQRLRTAGFNPGGVDGKFGARTDAAVRAFQRANQLQVDGKAGTRTMQALQRDSFDASPARRTATNSSAATTTRQTGNTRTAAQSTSSRAAEQVPYRNGRIPSNALTSVGNGHRMYGDAARAYTQMRDAARRDGVNIRLTDSYRSYAAQVDVARRKGIYGVRQPNGRLGLAARPGTSNHGLGRAVDVNLEASPGASRWLQQNASRFGFRTIPREPWHWEFRG